MPAADRLALQSDLAWLGYYHGPPGEDVDRPVIDAVKALQKDDRAKQTGILDAPERARLAAAAEESQQRVGWRLVVDPASGASFGLPDKLVSSAGASRLGGLWISGHGQIEIETFGLDEAGLAALFDREKKSPAGRQVDFSALKADSFVISETQGLKNFVVRAEARGRAVRGLTVRYDQATAGIMARVAIAMADSFHGFPDMDAALPPGQRPGVEYATAIVADRRGDLITAARAAAGCATITVPGLGHAVRIAADGAANIALLRLYGGRDLVPAAIGNRSQGGALTLVGIADPFVQNGGGAVSTAAAHRDGQNIEPAPEPGFAGAAAIDAQGRFAGMVVLKSAVVAANAEIAPRQAMLVPSAAVRAFLASHRIAPAGGRGAIEQSILRIICVR